MTEDVAAQLTMWALLASVAGGLVSGFALRWLHVRLTEEGLLLAVVLLTLYVVSQGVADHERLGRLVGRALVFGLFVAAVTIGDLLRRRVRPEQEPKLAATEEGIRMSRARLAAARLDVQAEVQRGQRQ